MKKQRPFLDTFLISLKSLLFFVVYYFVCAFVSALIDMIDDWAGKTVPSSLVGITAYTIVILAFLITFKALGSSLFKEATISSVKPIYIISGALFGFGYFGFYQTMAFVLQKIPAQWTQWLVNQQNEMASSQLDGNILIAVIYLCIFAPICEEIVFRGLMLTTLKGVIPKWGAIVACALCFGVMHAPSIIAMVVTFGFGILLGFIFHRTNSLIPCILAHILFNSANFLLFIPLNIGLYVVMIASIPAIIFSIILIARREKNENI